MAPFKVIIIGGGLAGSLLANGLQLHDIDFMVYERDVKESNRKGYQIRLGASALVGFRACLEKERMDLLMKKFGRSGGVISSAPILYSTKLETLLDLTKFPAYEKSAPINRVILRDFLAEPIYQAGKFQYGKKFVRYEVIETPGKSDRIRVHFEDGFYDEADLVVSAEGSYSQVNKQIGLNNIVHLTNYWGFLAKSSLPASKLYSLTPEVQKSPVCCVRENCFLYFSAYLPDKEDHTEDTSVKYDENSASVFWAIIVPSSAVPSEGAKSIEDKLDFSISLLRGWDTRYHDMLRSAGDDDIYVFQPRASTEPSKNWRKQARRTHGSAVDRIWLMGDAIHPMLPSRGMGANQALHDTAEALASILELSKLAKSSVELPDSEFQTAVDQYESTMIPRAFGWVRSSGGLRQDYIEPESIKGKVMIFAVARILDLGYLYGLVRWVFGYRPKDDAPELPN